MRSSLCASAALCLLISAGTAQAQSSVREPAQPLPQAQAQVQEQAPAKSPVPMSFGNPEARPTKNATRQAGQAGNTGEAAKPQPKFPNKDTAKNRRDYEMGTEHGQDHLTIDRGEDGGESVVSSIPPKKQQQAPGADMPIEVKVVAPAGRRY